MEGAIIGFGNMGKTHFKCYKDLGVEIAAIVDPFQDKCLKQIEDIPKDVDFIDICSPSYLHFEHLQKAMIFHKPIFVEKPIVIKKEEVNVLRQINYKNLIFVGEVEQFNQTLQPFLKYNKPLRNLKISRNVNLEFFLKNSYAWFLKPELSGGIVMDLMIHDLTLLTLKYGKPIVENVRFSKKRYSTPDNVSAILDFGTFKAEVESSWTSANKRDPIELEVKFNDVELKCNNYFEFKAKQNPFYLELKTFVDNIQNKQQIALAPYLDAIEVALEINQKGVAVAEA
ncbi:MAG: Gfo/Idh/MocA family oxidoreductase [Candidatus Micrarchaeota archaeon]